MDFLDLLLEICEDVLVFNCYDGRFDVIKKFLFMNIKLFVVNI